MASIADNKQFANRCGLDVNIYKYPKATDASELTIDFANECSLNLSSDITWATGGKAASKLIGFHNPIEGTFKISTQIMVTELLALASGADATAEAQGDVVFKNDSDAGTVYYVIEASTVWKNKEGTTEAENITIHKALPRKAYNVTYNGSGDPISVDIEFELLEDEDGNVVTISKA